MHQRNSSQGFSLVELLIVMVIAGVLAMIAVPSYQASVMKSRRADGRAVLNDTAQRLERCYTQFGGYNADGCAIDDGETIDSAGGFYQVSVAIADATTYTLTAGPEGPQEDDTKCGALEVTSTGVRAIYADGNVPITDDEDVAHCW